MANVLGPGESLANNQVLLSLNKAFMATLQPDGNFVVYKIQGMERLWATNTAGQTVSNAIMQEDGNFVLYNGSNEPIFASNTVNQQPSILVMQNDGNLVIYTNGASSWASNTRQ